MKLMSSLRISTNFKAHKIAGYSNFHLTILI